MQSYDALLLNILTRRYVEKGKNFCEMIVESVDDR
jgi:hypothetical protein